MSDEVWFQVRRVIRTKLYAVLIPVGLVVVPRVDRGLAWLHARLRS